jgi:Terpene synthase family 2, C-terminal metal binding
MAMGFPHLHYPWPAGLHPRADDVERETMRWLEDHRLVTNPAELERYRASRFGWLSASVTPRAEYAALVVAACLITWLFVLDDVLYDEVEPRPARVVRTALRYVRILELPDDPIDEHDPLAVALRDLRRRLAGADPPALVALRREVADCFHAGCWFTACLADGVVPPLREYVWLRPAGAGTYAAFALMRVTEGLRVTEAELCRPDVRALARMAGNVLVWQNDICSHFKEARRGTRPHLGLPSLLMRERGYGLEEAMNEAAGMHNAEVRAFCALEATTLPQLSREGALYVTGLRHWMRGNHDWALSSGRYEVRIHFDVRR